MPQAPEAQFAKACHLARYINTSANSESQLLYVSVQDGYGVAYNQGFYRGAILD